jgi:two-component system response regulator FlrC
MNLIVSFSANNWWCAMETECLDFIMNSPASMNVISLASRVAHFNVPVLVTGETGTGKECLAKYIHAAGLKGKSAPYIAVNCAAIPENMLEATLFGYEKGAFTGAVTRLAGKFEMANGGTLLLDEIGDMPLSLQAKILRVLQEQEIERLGSNKRIPLDFRLIACTNKNLDAAVNQGTFRQDLYYRLAVIPIDIPPLRERKEDIIPLAEYFIKKYSDNFRNDMFLSSSAKNVLMAYSWPGNVRELENVIQRGMIMCPGGCISSHHMGFGESISSADALSQIQIERSAHDVSSAITLVRRGRHAQYQYIVELISRHRGNKSKIAEVLGITTRALRYRLATMRENGIDVESYTKSARHKAAPEERQSI